MMRGTYPGTPWARWYSRTIGFGSLGFAAYSIEFNPLIGLFVIKPNRSIVLVHHDAWTAPVQMNVDH